MKLRADADGIIKESLAAVLPDAAVAKALTGHSFGAGRIVLVAQGDGASTSTSTAVGTRSAFVSLGTAFVSPEQAYNAIEKAITDAVYGKEGLLTQLGYGNNKGGKK